MVYCKAVAIWCILAAAPDCLALTPVGGFASVVLDWPHMLKPTLFWRLLVHFLATFFFHNILWCLEGLLFQTWYAWVCFGTARYNHECYGSFLVNFVPSYHPPLDFFGLPLGKWLSYSGFSRATLVTSSSLALSFWVTYESFYRHSKLMDFPCKGVNLLLVPSYWNINAAFNTISNIFWTTMLSWIDINPLTYSTYWRPPILQYHL